jgi:hypothetical protein
VVCLCSLQLLEVGSFRVAAPPQGTTDTGLDEDLCFHDPSAHAYGLWVKLLFLGVQRPRGLPLILY